MCIVFVLDGIFRPENSGRKIPVGKLIQHNNNEDVFVLDGIFRPESRSEQYIYIAQLTGDQLMVGHRVGLVDPNIRETVRGAWGDEEVEYVVISGRLIHVLCEIEAVED